MEGEQTKRVMCVCVRVCVHVAEVGGGVSARLLQLRASNACHQDPRKSSCGVVHVCVTQVCVRVCALVRHKTESLENFQLQQNLASLMRNKRRRNLTQTNFPARCVPPPPPIYMPSHLHESPARATHLPASTFLLSCWWMLSRVSESRSSRSTSSSRVTERSRCAGNDPARSKSSIGIRHRP